MAVDRVLPLWSGRTFALLGILLVAFNLRTAVAAVSPIARDIARDIPLDEVLLGLLGMIPPAAFAVAGIVGVRLSRRFGLERFLIIAIVMMTCGHMVRAVGNSFTWLVIGSVLALLGMGVGNILLPPMVKRYFPDRLGLMTGLYIAMITLSSALAAALAAPISELTNWRWSLGSWAALAVISLVPWLIVLVNRNRPEENGVEALQLLALTTKPSPLNKSVWRSRTAVTIAVTAAMSSLNFFVVLAWLPEMLIQLAGQTPLQAGALLALYSIVGLPASLLVPTLAVRMKRPGAIAQFSAVAAVLGFSGLLFFPEVNVWLWVLLLSGGQAAFPVCLVLINMRSRTPTGSVVLSSFSQGFGYGVATAGPLVVGVLRQTTGDFTAALVVMIVASIPVIITGTLLNRRSFIEDEVSTV